MKYDLPQTTPFRTNCERYQELIKKNGRTASEDIELAALATTLADYMIKANDWNTLEANVNNHLANVSNPHNVTTTQIGAETPTGAQAKVNAHVAASDPHPQYATDTDLSAHAGLTNPHSATSSATPNRLALRDANGRMQAAAPSAVSDVANQGYVDSMITKGSYTGNGTAARTISLPKTPKYVIIRGNTTYNTASANMKYETQHTDRGYLSGTASNFPYINYQVDYPRITTNGFIVDASIASNDLANKSAVVFDYLVFY